MGREGRGCVCGGGGGGCGGGGGGGGGASPLHSVGCQLLLGECLRFGFGFIIILQVSFVGEISLNTFF